MPEGVDQLNVGLMAMCWVWCGKTICCQVFLEQQLQLEHHTWHTCNSLWLCLFGVVHNAEHGACGVLHVQVEVLEELLILLVESVVIVCQGGVGWLFDCELYVWAPVEVSILDHLVVEFGVVNGHTIFCEHVSGLVPDNAIVQGGVLLGWGS